FAEEILNEFFDGDRKMLPQPRQVDELEVDHLDLKVFRLGEHVLGRRLGICNSWPGRDGHDGHSPSGVNTRRVRHPAGLETAVDTLLPRRGVKSRASRAKNCPGWLLVLTPASLPYFSGPAFVQNAQTLLASVVSGPARQ